MTALVREKGALLQHVPTSLKADKDVVMAIVGHRKLSDLLRGAAHRHGRAEERAESALKEWRSGKRRREEGPRVETGNFSFVTTEENGEANSSSGKTPLARLIEVKTEAAEDSEEADKLASQQPQYIDFLQAKIDDLKELALEYAEPDGEQKQSKV